MTAFTYEAAFKLVAAQGACVRVTAKCSSRLRKKAWDNTRRALPPTRKGIVIPFTSRAQVSRGQLSSRGARGEAPNLAPRSFSAAC